MRGLVRGAVLGTVAAAGLALSAAPAAAQGSVSLTPYAGIFVPTRNSYSSLGTDIRRRNAFIGGARLTFWGKSPIGVEVTAGFSPAKTTIAGATLNGDSRTNVFVGSVKLVAGVSPASSGIGFFVGGGPAIIRRGRNVLLQDSSRTNLGGVLGAGVRFPFSKRVGLRLDAEDYLYGGDFDGTKKFQNDLAFTAGLSIAF